ncbi:hypothetical protein HPB52_015502 [Rhipicephalus sanguineus]|uniref:Uncharacterized protein n=1 Tax=Rhipicephalus sanguineus TaxID=34632 RepID=A0A9D4T450_RHISA|nr:hypothetical protein HPB52_015502 [Rhipicephalus sanguineus]
MTIKQHGTQKTHRGGTSGLPARVEEAGQASTTAAWASSLGAATTQASGTQRGHMDTAAGTGGAAFLLQRRTMEGAKTGVPRPAPAPCPVAVPRLHSLGSRCGGRGGPAAVTSRRSILCHMRRGGALQEPLQRRPARGADTPAPLGQRSDADLAAICRRRLWEDPQFAVLLTVPPTSSPPTSSRSPTAEVGGGVGTMDVDQLLEL